jgi:hypothetical protein
MGFGNGLSNTNQQPANGTKRALDIMQGVEDRNRRVREDWEPSGSSRVGADTGKTGNAAGRRKRTLSVICSEMDPRCGRCGADRQYGGEADNYHAPP